MSQKTSGRKSGRSTAKSSLSSLLVNQTRLVVSVVALLVIAVGGFMYATSTQTINSNAGTAEGDIIADAESCSVDNEATDLPEECTTLASNNEVVSTCAYELPEDQAADCPEQAATATATLGDTTSKFPMVWPIKTENWPKIKQPIANCDLLYSRDDNKTISTGIEIEVPAGTPVYAAAAGEVVYATAGQGIVIVKTTLKNSKGKTLYNAYAHLSERSVSVGSKIAQNQKIALTGDAPGFELSHSLHFGVWTTGDFIGGHPLLNSATGKTLLTKMEHPMNYLPLDGRNVFSCKTVRPYVLPVSTGTAPAPTPSPGTGGTVNGQVFPLKTTKSAIRNRSIFSGGTTSRGGHPYIAYDIYVKNGTPVVSMTTGKVSKISRDVCGGTIVGIYSSSLNRRYSYMHLRASTVKVGVGRSVSPGTLLGYVGPTATASCHTVDHLHIDAVHGSVRVSCARSNCPASHKKYFINIGPDLYKTYLKIPG